MKLLIVVSTVIVCLVPTLAEGYVTSEFRKCFRELIETVSTEELEAAEHECWKKYGHLTSFSSINPSPLPIRKKRFTPTLLAGAAGIATTLTHTAIAVGTGIVSAVASTVGHGARVAASISRAISRGK